MTHAIISVVGLALGLYVAWIVISFVLFTAGMFVYVGSGLVAEIIRIFRRN